MVAVNQNDLRIKNAENLVNSFNGPNGEAKSYVFIGRAAKWDEEVALPMVPRQKAGDMSPPYPDNNFKDFNKVHDQMLSLKRINDTDVFHMIPRVTWTSGVTYDKYRHDYNEFMRSTSNAKNLYNAVYYTVTQTRDVFVCLDNNNGIPSLVEPKSITDEPFYTTDGYQWLKVYTVPSIDFDIHSTNNLIPIVDEKVVSTVPGAIHTVIIESAGNNYTINPAGYSNTIPYYYCNITGDGTGAIARVSITDGRISTVRVIENGQDYTYGILDFVAGRVYASIGDLKNKVNGLNPLGDGTFVTSVIIPPPGGWGYDRIESSNAEVRQEESKKTIIRLSRQLGGYRVGVFSSFDSDLNDFIENTQFRQIGILQDLEGHEKIDLDGTITGYPETISACHAVKVKELVGSAQANYLVGETIIQTKVDTIDPTIKYRAKGTVVGWDADNNVLNYIQDPSIHYDENHNMLYEITGTEQIEGQSSNKQSTPDVDYAAVLKVEINHITFSSGYSKPEFDKYSGNIIYLTNLSPIQRDDTQSERVSLVITY